MYRIIPVFIFSFLSFLCLAEEKKPLVLATASMIADMAENIGGDFVDIQSIVPIGGDPHLYEPTPGDAVLVSKSDLVLRNGLTFEGWLNELIENSGTKAELVRVTEGIDHITSVVYENAPDPHAWMDVEHGIIYAENIKDALIRLLPAHQKEFEFNFNAYKSTLQELNTFIHTEISKIPPKRRVLITSHDAFQYYGRKYGLTLESVLGTSTEAQAQTSDIVRLNKVIKDSGVPSVFIETTVNPKLLQQIAKDNDVVIGGKLFSDSLGDQDSEAPTYVEMMKYNTLTIVQALTKNKEQAPAEDKQSSSNLMWLLPLFLIAAFITVFIVRRRSNT